MAGMTPQGLLIKRLPEVIEDIVEHERIEINENISTDDDEFLGQLNTIYANEIADQWMLAEAVSDSWDLSKAEGVSLDKLGAIIGVPRQQPLPSSGMQRFTVQNGTTIVAGFLVENPITRNRFYTEDTYTISTNSCYSARYTVRQMIPEAAYTIAVNGTSYSVLSDDPVNVLDILNGLAEEINEDSAATYSATVYEDTLELEIVTDNEKNIAITSVTYIGPTSVQYDIFVRAVEDGPLVVPANSVINAVTAVGGLFSTTNPASFFTGRNLETDEEYRQRLKNSKSARGRGTVDAITAALLSTSGVTSAIVYENPYITVDADSRPPKSFEAVVMNGTDTDVATSIWESKPAGIETYGNTSVVIVDENSMSREIKFTRAVAKNLAIKITYSLYDEEIFPVNGEDIMKQVSVDFVSSLGTNEDFIPSRLFGPIYSAVEGVDSLVIEVQVIPAPGDTPDPGDWQSTRLPVEFDEIAKTTLADIYVDEEA